MSNFIHTKVCHRNLIHIYTLLNLFQTHLKLPSFYPLTFTDLISLGAVEWVVVTNLEPSHIKNGNFNMIFQNDDMINYYHHMRTYQFSSLGTLFSQMRLASE